MKDPRRGAAVMREARGHNFHGHLFHWKYCTKCGLITLRNKATAKEMNRACKGDEE